MAFLQLSVFYIIFIGHITFYQDKAVQKTEILNESIGLCMGYSYLMLVNIVSERKERHHIGMTIVLAAFSLIFINFGMLGLIIYQKAKLKFKKFKNKKRFKHN